MVKKIIFIYTADQQKSKDDFIEKIRGKIKKKEILQHFNETITTE